MSKVHVTDELATKREFGYPVVGEFRTDLPILSDLGFVRFVDARAMDSVQVAPPELEAYIEARLPRYERGAAETDADLVRAMLTSYGRPSSVAEYRRAIESYAIPAGLLPPGPMRDAAASAPDAIFPWGKGRDVFRRNLEEAKRRAAEEAAEAAERARLAAMPNRKTLRELGYVGVLLPHGSAPGSWPRWLSGLEGIPPYEELRHAGLPTDEGHVLLFRPRFGVDFADERIEHSPCRYVSSYAPPSVPKVKARPLPFGALESRGCEHSPCSVSRDGRTADGEKAEEDFAAMAKRHAADIAADGYSTTWARWLTQVGRRGFGLRRELVIHVIERTFAGRWSRDRLVKLLDVAERGESPWVDVDELYTPPAASFVERFAESFGIEDEAKTTLRALVEGKDTVTSAECIAALGIDRPTNADHERVLRAMAALGWAKRQVTIEGQKTRAFVRGTP